MPPSDSPDLRSQRLYGLPPVYSAAIKVLVLGSFPGKTSLAQQQYYAHPRNQFWPLVAAIWPQYALPESYAARCAWLVDRGVGLWDVYASCERVGSLDSAIRNPELNDFEALGKQCPHLKVFAHNGKQSFQHARELQKLSHVSAASLYLPSTSPANASWSFERKLAVWQEVMHQAHLL